MKTQSNCKFEESRFEWAVVSVLEPCDVRFRNQNRNRFRNGSIFAWNRNQDLESGFLMRSGIVIGIWIKDCQNRASLVRITNSSRINFVPNWSNRQESVICTAVLSGNLCISIIICKAPGRIGNQLDLLFGLSSCYTKCKYTYKTD